MTYTGISLVAAVAVIVVVEEAARVNDDDLKSFIRET
jgi:hypothetical protein